MINKFSNVDTQKNTLPSKKSGRPRKPNMVPYVFKMDKQLHADLKQFSENQGVTKSSVVTLALRALLGSPQGFEVKPLLRIPNAKNSLTDQK